MPAVASSNLCHFRIYWFIKIFEKDRLFLPLLTLLKKKTAGTIHKIDLGITLSLEPILIWEIHWYWMSGLWIQEIVDWTLPGTGLMVLRDKSTCPLPGSVWVNQLMDGWPEGPAIWLWSIVLILSGMFDWQIDPPPLSLFLFLSVCLQD